MKRFLSVLFTEENAGNNWRVPPAEPAKSVVLLPADGTSRGRQKSWLEMLQGACPGIQALHFPEFISKAHSGEVYRHFTTVVKNWKPLSPSREAVEKTAEQSRVECI